MLLLNFVTVALNLRLLRLNYTASMPEKLRKDCVKNGDYLQYLLIKNGYVIKRFDSEEAIRQVGKRG